MRMISGAGTGGRCTRRGEEGRAAGTTTTTAGSLGMSSTAAEGGASRLRQMQATDGEAGRELSSGDLETGGMKRRVCGAGLLAGWDDSAERGGEGEGRELNERPGCMGRTEETSARTSASSLSRDRAMVISSSVALWDVRHGMFSLQGRCSLPPARSQSWPPPLSSQMTSP